ncbi:hypothetical protein M3Y94_00760300 [Aphelenchoides besseyi]|nr:hypothetical protein M3Y94_00760300 [Aphelenchoides besseyi]
MSDEDSHKNHRKMKGPLTTKRLTVFFNAACLEFYSSTSRKFMKQGNGLIFDEMNVNAIVQDVKGSRRHAENKEEFGRVVRGTFDKSCCKITQVNNIECQCDKMRIEKWNS